MAEKIFFDLNKKEGTLDKNPENYPDSLELNLKNVPKFRIVPKFSTSEEKGSVNLYRALKLFQAGEEIFFCTEDRFFGNHEWRVLVVIPDNGCFGSEYFLLLEEPKIARASEIRVVLLQPHGVPIIMGV